MSNNNSSCLYIIASLFLSFEYIVPWLFHIHYNQLFIKIHSKPVIYNFKIIWLKIFIVSSTNLDAHFTKINSRDCVDMKYMIWIVIQIKHCTHCCIFSLLMMFFFVILRILYMHRTLSQNAFRIHVTFKLSYFFAASFFVYTFCVIFKPLCNALRFVFISSQKFWMHLDISLFLGIIKCSLRNLTVCV